MTNEEKAREIANDITKYGGKWVSDEEVIEGCMQMAQWKDEQFKEQKKFIWKDVKYIIELDGNIETDNFMGSDEYYQAIADKANVVLFGLQGKLDN